MLIYIRRTMRINAFTTLLLVALAIGSASAQFGARISKRQSGVGQANGYFYPEPSPSFTLPPVAPPTTTTRPAPPPPPPVQPVVVPTTPATSYIPPATQVSYIQCSGAQQCVSASVCASRPGGSVGAPSGTCQAGGTIGVCCNPPPPVQPVVAPTTTTYRPPAPAPTTTPATSYIPPATQVSYIQCSGAQQCVSASVCASRPGGSVGAPSGTCQAGGTTGVCCNPPPPIQPVVVPTAAPAPSAEYLPPVVQTTSRPGYDNYGDANTGNQNILRPTTAAPSRPAPVTTTTSRPQTAAVVDDEIAFWDFRESIPGDPETDYPILDKIPVTSFTCVGKLDGFYADTETRCQVFHVCASIPDAEPIKSSFLCPNGTIFNQEVFVCQWWPDVDCATSSNFYNLNSNIGKVPESAAGSGAPVKISAAGAATNNVAVSVAAPSYTAGGSVAASASASSASGYGAPAQGAAALATSYLAPPPAKGGY